MSCDKWAYDPEKCDGYPCCGDCDFCSKAQEDATEIEQGSLIYAQR